VLFTLTSLLAPGYAAPDHLPIFLLQASFIGIAALGQFTVVVAGGIDLSMPSTITASAIILSLFVGSDNSALLWAVPLVLLMAAGVGIVNGIGVAVLGASPIIITLAMNVLVQGLLIAVTGGAKANAVTSSLESISDGRIAGVPGAVLIWLALTIVLIVVMSLTSFGRRLYALGSRRTVAVLSGVRPTRNLVATYVISAVFASIAGILLAGHTGQPYLGMGDDYLFVSVAAVAIGGASILGGTGSPAGAAAGALTLTILEALFPIMNLSPATLNIAYAVAIIGTVTLSTRSGRLRR
jgi:ribose transport system permease protein